MARKRSLTSAGIAPRGSVVNKEFILTPRAAQDVNDVWNHIADDNIEAADRVLDALHKALKSWRGIQR
jgi:hypothetical protein